MHFLNFVLSGLVLLAAPAYVLGEKQGWYGSGATYQIVNVLSGTAIDLYNGKTKVNGWKRLV